MIKICHVTDSLNIGGLEKTLIEIVDTVRTYEHQVWCLKKKGVLAQKLAAKGIPVREFNFEGGLKFFLLLRLAKEMKKENFVIIHSHGFFPSIWGRAAALIAGIPVTIVHCQNIYYGVSLRNRIKFYLLSLCTTRIVAVSKAVEKSLREYVGIPGGKITVIYNSAARIKPKTDRYACPVRKSLGIAKEDFVIGTIARIEAHKGQEILINAIAECKRQGFHCKCLIAGEGPEYMFLKLLVTRMKLDDTVVFLGWRDDIAELLYAMDVFVQPSLLKEGLPLALAEAASAGLPLIATDIGGNSEIVMDSVNGFIIPPANPDILAKKIRYLMENAGVRNRMGNYSRQIWEEKFTLEEMLRRIESVYAHELRRHFSERVSPDLPVTPGVRFVK